MRSPLMSMVNRLRGCGQAPARRPSALQLSKTVLGRHMARASTPGTPISSSVTRSASRLAR
eukprot:scaffold67933_cov45-Phaeocystis_antarctica.AAC.3